MGSIVIGPGGETQATVVPGSTELGGMKYSVVFSGPGGTQIREFGPHGGTVQLASGNYRITVRAVNAVGRLRGLTEQSVSITSGVSKSIVLDTVIGVTTFVELQDALQGSSGFTNSSHERNIIVVENDIPITAGIAMGAGTYTLVSEPGKTAVLTRDSGYSGSLITVPSGTDLVLGSAAAGLTGNIEIEGTTIDTMIDATGSFTVNPGVTLKSGSIAVHGAAVSMPGLNQAWDTEDFGANQTVDYLFFSAASLNTDLNYCLTHLAALKNYAIIVEGDHTIDGSFNFPGSTNISLRGSGTISRNAAGGTLFRFQGTGKKLILRGPTLIGPNGSNTDALVFISSGEFVMYTGKITGNNNNVGVGGGVVIGGGCTFTMKGGEISGNKALDAGGGVYVSGTFNMSGGIIGGGGITNANNGGGVYVALTGSFNMSNTAVISNNKAAAAGGGVYSDGSFTMSGGTIYGSGAGALANSAVSTGASFYKNNGTAKYSDNSNILGGTSTNDTIVGR